MEVREALEMRWKRRVGERTRGPGSPIDTESHDGSALRDRPDCQERGWQRPTVRHLFLASQPLACDGSLGLTVSFTARLNAIVSSDLNEDFLLGRSDFQAMGFHILSDGWAAYYALDQIQDGIYLHDQVIHDDNFVDPEDPDIHTNPWKICR
eukprot:snap_masked-scaffold1929_size24837-processed-gene-0.1 protein:Tk07465 transcript:snap_masked-scaffold1929_size24837-processed-gene-0.1-mRNA-1 annotation:"hypothetical protein CRE_13111"